MKRSGFFKIYEKTEPPPVFRLCGLCYDKVKKPRISAERRKIRVKYLIPPEFPRGPDVLSVAGSILSAAPRVHGVSVYVKMNLNFRREFFMSKVLCLFSMALSLIIALIFILDLSAGIPFHRGSITLDVVFLVASLIIAVLSWFTFREQ